MAKESLSNFRFGTKRVLITSRASRWLLACVLVSVLLLGSVKTSRADALPYFEISDVAPTTSVSLRFLGLPEGVDFVIRMGEHGTQALGGYVVGEIPPGTTGAYDMIVAIPTALKYKNWLDIRMDSTENEYGFYDSFYNYSGSAVCTTCATSTTGSSSYYGYIPTFSITSVVEDESVTVQTYNFPASQTFAVRMGPFGTLGIGGTMVATVDSGSGGSFSATFSIPDSLKGKAQIAIRMDSPQGYYAYNWFDNAVVEATVSTPIPGSSSSVPSWYYGYPYFYIMSVVRDDTVTIDVYNLPPDQDFVVTMGPYGSYGIGGIVVATTNSGVGGYFTLTYDIPPALAGSYQIAIRMQSSLGYYAYNWFYNNTTTP